MNDVQLYSTSFMARLFMVTERRVQQLTKEKVLPQVARGKYDIVPTIQAYVRYLNERIRSGDDADLQRERALLTKAQREKAELELAALKGEMHRGEDVMAVWTENVANCRARLLAIPAKSAPSLFAARSVGEIQEQLKAAVYEALDELSEYSKGRISGVDVVDEV